MSCYPSSNCHTSVIFVVSSYMAEKLFSLVCCVYPNFKSIRNFCLAYHIYFGNFVSCILVIQGAQNHLLCLFTYLFCKARQAKRNFKDKQNHATKVTKIQWRHENGMSQTYVNFTLAAAKDGNNKNCIKLPKICKKNIHCVAYNP